jgi:nicotinate dehydrogenase subunit B
MARSLSVDLRRRVVGAIEGGSSCRAAAPKALYAFLMSQPAVTQINAPSRLTFPFNVRPLMAAWNLMFNHAGPEARDPAQFEIWNRGRYLVDGLGHCGACHTLRNVLGAERGGRHYLAGGIAEGWDAPALTLLSEAPIPWAEDEIFAYLRTGASRYHGAAAGPMAPVIAELKAAPDADLRAMAVYLASLNAPISDAEATAHAERMAAATASGRHPATSAAARLFEGACASCHEAAGAPIANLGPSLGFSTSLHAARPDNFLHAVRDGISASPHGAMPGFAGAFDDHQLAELARYARARFAPDKPAWEGLDEAMARISGQATR